MAKREIPEINAGSMADIAFLLLIFFLVATTMDVDTGITRLLPPIPEDQQKEEVDVKERNVLVVLINKDDQLMVEGQIMDLARLKETTLEFFSNPNDDPNLPEKEIETIEFPQGQSARWPDGIAQIPVSKGVVSLQNDRSTTYGKYLQVQNELVAAVSELRNQFTIQNFGRKYDELNPLKSIDEGIINGVNKVYKMNISEAEPKNIGGVR
jgi:biopolymer transport protein ExbD